MNKAKFIISLASSIVVIIAVTIFSLLIIIPNVRYDHAVKLFNKGDYAAASSAIMKMSMGYKDVKNLYPYYSAYDAFESGDYDEAAQLFGSLGNYANAYDMQKESSYLNANMLLTDGQYDKAISAFEALSGYKDSIVQLNECRYHQANKIITSDPERAKDIFDGLAVYKDSKDKLKECDYYTAINLLDAKNYGEAFAAFQLLDDYKDSQNMLLECRYRKAVDRLNETDYDGAIERFTVLSGYKDSNDMLLKCNYLKGQDLLSQKKYGEAYSAFQQALDYEDSKVMLDECRYEKAVDLFAEGDYSGAYERFAALGNYKDSNSRKIEADEAMPVKTISDFVGGIVGEADMKLTRVKSIGTIKNFEGAAHLPGDGETEYFTNDVTLYDVKPGAILQLDGWGDFDLTYSSNGNHSGANDFKDLMQLYTAYEGDGAKSYSYTFSNTGYYQLSGTSGRVFNVICVIHVAGQREETIPADISVKINGELIDFPDQKPVIVDNYVMIPIDVVYSAMDQYHKAHPHIYSYFQCIEKFNYNSSSKTIEISGSIEDWFKYYITVGKKNVVGVYQTHHFEDESSDAPTEKRMDDFYTLSVAPIIMGNRVMVPVNSLPKLFMITDISWDYNTRTVYITY